MSRERWRITLRGNGKAYVQGNDQPEADTHMLLSNGLLVLKVPGHSYWSGRGQSSYAGAEFQVYQITEVAPDSPEVWAERVLSFGVRRSEAAGRAPMVLDNLRERLGGEK